MKILAVSDAELDLIYSPRIKQRFNDIDLIISCGDLPYYYLDYMVSMLDVPLYFVRGNHASKVEYGVGGKKTKPLGGIDLHQRCKRDKSGLLLCGIEGSLQYNNGPYQYSQFEMWIKVLKFVPRLLLNKMFYGRYVDILVTHAPPWKINDQDDLPHRGIKAFRWFIKTFQPAYHLHGHIHIYWRDKNVQKEFASCQIMNVFGFKELELDLKQVSKKSNQ